MSTKEESQVTKPEEEDEPDEWSVHAVKHRPLNAEPLTAELAGTREYSAPDAQTRTRR